MEGNPDTGPRHDSDRAQSALTSRCVRNTCPFCDANDWQSVGQLGNLLTVLPAVTPHGELVPAYREGDAGGPTFYVWICANCGFSRLHSTFVLDAETKSETD